MIVTTVYGRLSCEAHPIRGILSALFEILGSLWRKRECDAGCTLRS